MKFSKTIIAVSAVLSIGCGGSDLCKRAQSTITTLRTKSANCPTFANAFTPYTDAQTAACSTTLKTCTAADNTTLTTQLDCLDKVAACVAGSEQAFSTALSNCSTGTVTSGCGCLPTGTACQNSAQCCGASLCGGSNTCT